jgi:hypothetical protein
MNNALNLIKVSPIKSSIRLFTARQLHIDFNPTITARSSPPKRHRQPKIMCILKIIVLACGHRSHSHTITKVFCLHRLRQGVPCLKWGRKYKALKYSCRQCEQESQFKGKSSNKDGIDSVEDGDTIDECSESDDAESSNGFCDGEEDESMTEAPLYEENDGSDEEEEGDKDEHGDVEMSDDGGDLSEKTIQMMVNVFNKAAEFHYRNGPSFVLSERPTGKP